MASGHFEWCDPRECAPDEDTHASTVLDLPTQDASHFVHVWVARTHGQTDVWLAFGLDSVRLSAEQADTLARELAAHARTVRDITTAP